MDSPANTSLSTLAIPEVGSLCALCSHLKLAGFKPAICGTAKMISFWRVSNSCKGNPSQEGARVAMDPALVPNTAARSWTPSGALGGNMRCERMLQTFCPT